ncbi:SpoIID/LytB domain-containing protein [Syntrophobotulus glycolicus]|nr:SpoIID/LytB domain-containing protein [Syntrophobotulus glycolicus]
MQRLSVQQMAKLIIVLAAAIFLTSPAACSAQNVSVRLVWNYPDAKWLEVKCLQGEYTFVCNGRSQTVNSGDKIQIGQSGLVQYININHKPEVLQSAKIELKNLQGVFQVREPGKSWKSFRGSLEITREKLSWKLTNTLDREDYLKGVVPAEMSNAWADKGMEALKAQAVTARTYLVKNMDRSGYITDSPNIHQAYKGRSAEGRASEAVAATSGEILVDEKSGQPISVFYSAHNGGHTEVTENVWSNHDSHYESYADPYSRGIGGFTDSWFFLISAENLGKTYGLAPIKSVTLEKYDSGRVAQVQLKDWLGAGKTVKGSQFVNQFYPFDKDISREAFLGRLFTVSYLPAESSHAQGIIGLGEDRIKNRMTGDDNQAAKNSDREKNGPRLGYIKNSNEGISDTLSSFGIFKFQGSGWGHGVGMSQWGAYNMAINGLTYQDILGFYYKQMNIRKE